MDLFDNMRHEAKPDPNTPSTMELTQRGKSAHAGDAEDPHQEHKTDLSTIHLEQAGSVDSDEPRPLEDR